jgi:hypothetical protein
LSLETIVGQFGENNIFALLLDLQNPLGIKIPENPSDTDYGIFQKSFPFDLVQNYPSIVVKNENPAFPRQSFDKFIVPNRTCPCSTKVSAAGCSLIS